MSSELLDHALAATTNNRSCAVLLGHSDSLEIRPGFSTFSLPGVCAVCEAAN